MYVVMSIQTSQYIIPGLSVCWFSARWTLVQYLQRAFVHGNILLVMEFYFYLCMSLRMIFYGMTHMS